MNVGRTFADCRSMAVEEPVNDVDLDGRAQRFTEAVGDDGNEGGRGNSKTETIVRD